MTSRDYCSKDNREPRSIMVGKFLLMGIPKKTFDRKLLKPYSNKKLEPQPTVVSISFILENQELNYLRGKTQATLQKTLYLLAFQIHYNEQVKSCGFKNTNLQGKKNS